MAVPITSCMSEPVMATTTSGSMHACLYVTSYTQNIKRDWQSEITIHFITVLFI